MREGTSRLCRILRGSRPFAALAALAVACTLLGAAPSPARALSVSAAANTRLKADVGVSLTADDPAGLGLLFVDGRLAGSALVGPSASVTFRSVPLTPGSHRLTAVIRCSSGLVHSPARTIVAWADPTATLASAPSGLCRPTVSIGVRTTAATKLTVLVNGKAAVVKTVAPPSAALRLSLALPARGANKVELRAENPASKGSSTFILSRPLWPLPGHTLISSPFGWRWGRMHEGTDLPAPTGTTIIAAGAGKVVWAGPRGDYGNLVILDHGGGITTRYGHQSRIVVKLGAQVGAGQKIGEVGSTGHSTGPHLHFEIRVNGTATDPMGWL